MEGTRPLTIKDRQPCVGDVLKWGYKCYCGQRHEWTSRVAFLTKTGKPHGPLPTRSWSPRSLESFLNSGKQWAYVSRADGGPVHVSE